MMFRRCGSIGVLAACCMAAAPATPIATAVHGWAADLTAADPAVAAEAALRLESVDPDNVPLLDAATRAPDLSTDARAALRELLAQQRSRFAGLAVERHRDLARWQWWADSTLAAYQAGSHRSVAWDDDVAAGIALYRSAGTAWAEPDDRKATYERAVSALSRALSKGCDDPIVGVVRSLALTASERPADAVLSTFVDAARHGDPTDPQLRLVLDLRLLEALHDRREAKVPTMAMLSLSTVFADPQPRLADAFAQLRLLAERSDMPGDLLYDLAARVRSAAVDFDEDSDAVDDRIVALFRRAQPDGACTLELRGDRERDHARDAADGETRQAVSERADVADHLTDARTAYEAAWRADAGNHRLAVSMLGVLLLQRADRPAFEAWFRRAIATGPDDREAYRIKAQYLSSHYAGSSGALAAFARECAASTNVVGGVPMEALTILQSLAPKDADGAATFWARDDVWREISAVFESTLALYPKADPTRSSYAAWACFCGRWPQAVVLFDQLGDKVDASAFESQGRVVDVQRRAMREARRALEQSRNRTM